MNKAYYLFKITYSRLKHCSYSRYSKSYLERPNYGNGNGNGMERLYIKVAFFISNKRNGKNFIVKYIQ